MHIMTEPYNYKQPIRWYTSYLLWKLEYLDPSNNESWFFRMFGFVESRKRRIKKKIMRNVQNKIRTILKFSRHEGWDYRDEIYEIIKSYYNDPVDLLIHGLNDPDLEIRWSCAKWLRDKVRSDRRPIKPLINYLRTYSMEGDVSTTLQFMEIDAEDEIIDVIMDDSLPYLTRFDAVLYFDSIDPKISKNGHKKLLNFSNSKSHETEMDSEIGEAVKRQLESLKVTE